MGTPRLPIAGRLRGLLRLGLLPAAILAGALLSAGLASAQPLQPGEAYVTRFSGFLFGAAGPIIDPNGTVGSIIIDGAAGEHPGIIDEDIEPAELLGDFAYQILNLLGIGLVGLEGGGAHALALEFLGDGLGLVGGRGIAHGDVGALIGKLLGDGGTDAARPAGDQRHLSGKWFGRL